MFLLVASSVCVCMCTKGRVYSVCVCVVTVPFSFGAYLRAFVHVITWLVGWYKIGNFVPGCRCLA